jgi:hypothetical protein
MRRPLTGEEVEEWIAHRDPDLFNEIATKCYDYVRIILSLTPRDRIIKLKCISGISGQNRRLAFYGSGKVSYNPEHWVPLSRDRKSKQPEESAPAVWTHPQTTLFPAKPIPAFNANVSQEKLEKSWLVLKTLHFPDSAFSPTFQSAIKTLKERVGTGSDPAIALQDVMRENPSLAHPVTSEEVVHVLRARLCLMVQYRNATPLRCPHGKGCRLSHGHKFLNPIIPFEI